MLENTFPQAGCISIQNSGREPAVSSSLLSPLPSSAALSVCSSGLGHGSLLNPHTDTGPQLPTEAAPWRTCGRKPADTAENQPDSISAACSEPGFRERLAAGPRPFSAQHKSCGPEEVTESVCPARKATCCLQEPSTTQGDTGFSFRHSCPLTATLHLPTVRHRSVGLSRHGRSENGAEHSW